MHVTLTTMISRGWMSRFKIHLELCPHSQQALVGRNEMLMSEVVTQIFIISIMQLQQARSNILLACQRVPPDKPPGPMTVIGMLLQATSNVIKSWALENIAHLMHAWAESADVRNPWHAQPHAHVRAKVHQALNKGGGVPLPWCYPLYPLSQQAMQAL